MNNINVPLCAGNRSANTGVPSCGVSIDHLAKLIVCRQGFEIPLASCTDFETELAYLQAATLANNPMVRIFPVTVKGVTDDTEEPAESMFGFGDTSYYSEKTPKFTIELANNGIEYHKQLRAFNEWKDAAIYWVDTTFIGGNLTSTGFAPLKATVKAMQVKTGNSQEPTAYTLKVSLKHPKALTDLLETIAIPAGVDLNDDLHGLTDVTLSLLGTNTVGVTTKISKTNLYDSYADELAVVGAWTLKNNVTGAAVTVTSVTKDEARKGWVLAYTNVNPVTAYLAAPAALAALNVGSATSGGFEAESGVSLGE